MLAYLPTQRISCLTLPVTVSAARRSARLKQQHRTHQGVRSAYLGERGGKARGQVCLAAGQRETARAQRGLELRDRQLRRRRVGVRLGRAVALEHLRGGRRRMHCSPTLPWRAHSPSALPDFRDRRQAAGAAARAQNGAPRTAKLVSYAQAAWARPGHVSRQAARPACGCTMCEHRPAGPAQRRPPWPATRRPAPWRARQPARPQPAAAGR